MPKINIMHLRSVHGTGGGPEKTILLSGEKIDKERFNMIIVYLKGVKDNAFGVTEKAKGFNINYFEIPEKGKFDLNTIRKLKGLIREYKIDILHTHDYKTDFYGLVLSKMCNIKLVATTHGWIGNDLKERFYNWLDKKILNYYDCIVTVCEAMNRYLLNIGIPAKKMLTIHNGINSEDFKRDGAGEDLRNELNLPKGVFIIGVIGRLSKEKRIGLLFSMVKRVIKEIGDVKVLIVGEGPEKDNLITLAKEMAIEDNVIFIGKRNDIKRVYKTIDLLVCISSTEGLPNTVLEALAMEVPVVATDVGGVGEIIENKVNGLLFQPQDIKGIASGIILLLSDSALAIKFAKEGRKIIQERFSFDNRMRKIEKVYFKVLEQEKGDKLSGGKPILYHFKVIEKERFHEVESEWVSFLKKLDSISPDLSPSFIKISALHKNEPLVIFIYQDEILIGIITGEIDKKKYQSGNGNLEQIGFLPSVDIGKILPQLCAQLSKILPQIRVFRFYLPFKFIHEANSFYIKEVCGTIKVDLTESEEEIFKNLKKNRRNDIRYAEKNGVEIMNIDSKDMEKIKLFHLMLLSSGKAKGYKVCCEEFFLENFKFYRKLFLAYYKAAPIAGVVLRYFPEGGCCYECNASIPEYLNLKPNDLCLWKALLWAKNNGMKELNFSGIDQFKSQFGGRNIRMYEYSFYPKYPIVYRLLSMISDRAIDIKQAILRRLRPYTHVIL